MFTFGAAYYKCLGDVITTMALMARDFNAKQENASDPVTLDFTFDHRKESSGNAGTLYSMLVNLPEWSTASPFDVEMISFDSRQNPKSKWPTCWQGKR